MHYEDREELEKWAKIIEKATADGKFKDIKPPVTSPQTSIGSFFGAEDTHPTAKPTQTDAEYWKKVSDKSSNPYNMLNEDIDPVMVKEWRRQAGLVSESVKSHLANVAQSIAQSPNPIRAHTVGKDQALEPGPMGTTFSEKDIEALSEMKLQLHALENKLNEFEGLGKNGSKYEKQIKSLKDKIDDLSTSMCQSFPYSISPQGD